MLKVLAGVVLGYVLFTQPQARQVTADVLRFAADALAPEQKGKTLPNPVQKLLEKDK